MRRSHLSSADLLATPMLALAISTPFRGRMVYTPPRLFGLRVTYEIGGSK